MNALRTSLPAILDRFHEDPYGYLVHFGRHRRDEAVLLSSAAYGRLVAAGQHPDELVRLGALRLARERYEDDRFVQGTFDDLIPGVPGVPAEALRWHEEVLGDLVSIRARCGPAAAAEAGELVSALPVEPRLGPLLEHRDGIDDLASCRQVAFGAYEVGADGVNLGPALRLVYRLRPDEPPMREVEVLAVATRADLEARVLAIDAVTPRT